MKATKVSVRDCVPDMKNLWILLYVLIYVKTGLCTIKCNPKDDCVCHSGPEIHCPANYTDDESFVVIHIEEGEEIAIDCYNIDTFPQHLLPNITINTINLLSLNHCPLPPGGFKTLLDHFSIPEIKVLEFERCFIPDITFTKSDFRGLGSLEVLKLQHLNGTTRLDEDVFLYTPNLAILDLDRNKLDMHPKFFKNTPLLERLYMAQTSLEKIPEDLFVNLDKMEKLHLWKNQLTTIDEDTFKGLVNLQSLELTENKIHSVHENAFENLTEIVRISLNNNNLTVISDSVFRSNKKLKEVRMAYNVDLRLPDYLFANLPLLEIVDLRGCHFNSVPEYIFENSTQLRVLKLGTNNLTHFPRILFKGLENLETLDVSNNLISHIEKDTLQFLTSLVKINFEGNLISRIHHDAFYNNKGLKTINLSHNQFSTESMIDFSRIENLDFSYNLITRVDAIISAKKMRHLKKIDLSYNRIAAVSIKDLQFSTETDVNLNNNNITVIKFPNVGEIVVPGYAVISVDNNPLECDCYNYDLVKYLRNKKSNEESSFEIIAEDLRCASPPQMKNVSVDTLSMSDLKCSMEKLSTTYTSCPMECSCIWRPHDKSAIIDCANKNFTYFPKIDLKEMSFLKFDQVELYLEGNNLNLGPDNNLGYDNISHLYLSYNQIKTITWLPPKLKLLTLDNNQINHLDLDVIKTLSSSTLVNLTLEKNPWRCDCEASELANFLLRRPKQFQDIYCENSNKLLIDLNTRLCPYWWIIYTSAAAMTVLLVVAILFALFYRHQQDLKIWLFAHDLCLWWVTEEVLDEDKIYDAFISYSHKDEDFVIQNLLPILEGGSSPYKLCLHYRDFVPGEFIEKQIISSVQDSRRTLVVLSKNFLESVWAKNEFRTAHGYAMTEGRARVIVVLYGEVDLDNLDDELKSYLGTNTYVKWGDPYFWRKLKYALPHKNGRISNNNQTIANIMQCIDDQFDLVVPSTPDVGTTPPVLALDADKLKEHPLSFRHSTIISTPPAEGGNFVKIL